jgi:hypothetical protein
MASTRYIDMSDFKKAAPQIKAALDDAMYLINQVKASLTTKTSSKSTAKAITALSGKISSIITGITQVITQAPIVGSVAGSSLTLYLSIDPTTLAINVQGQLSVIGSAIIGSGMNGLPLLRIGVSGGDNIARIQTSQDGLTWSDTDITIYAP